MFLFSPGSSMAQTAYYDHLWEQIEEYEQQGMLKSTLPWVNLVYDRAVKENESEQRIRSLLYQAKINLITQDSGRQEAVLYARFKSEIAKARPVEKHLMQSLLAGFLNEYYQQYRYRMDGRTDMADTAKGDDFLAWTGTAMQEEIEGLFERSLSEAALLQQERVDEWKFLLDTATKYRELRPTLYDLLTHRAYEYFHASNKLDKAASLLVNLQSFHQDSGNKNAYLYNRLLQVELKRMSYAAQIAELKAMAKLFPEAWYTSEVLLKLASKYRNQVFQLASNEEKKAHLDSVLAIGQLVESRYGTTTANVDLQESLVRSILSSSVSVQAQRYNPPGKTIPVWISHKNVNKIFVRILAYKRDFSSVEGSSFSVPGDIHSQADLDSLIALYPVVEEFSSDLKPFDDYQDHSTMLSFDPLQTGEYLILLSDNESFLPQKNRVLAIQSLSVSRYALATRANELLLIDRETGELMPHTEIAMLKRLRAGQNDYEWQKKAAWRKLRTDADGTLTIEPEGDLKDLRYHPVMYQVMSEPVYFETQYNTPRAHVEQATQRRVQLFTDRAIYRPGQTVFFKGIVYEVKGENRQVLTNREVVVELYDVNDSEIAVLKLKSNEYGSVFGNFILPQGGTLGTYHLRVSKDRGYHDFRVEEYKRPTFEVMIDSLKEAYKLGQEVTVRGAAQAFSGAWIDGADIRFTVTRRSRFLYHSFATRFRRAYSPPVQVAEGTASTDDKGRFALTFIAEADSSQEEGFRFYDYEIQVSATDRQGETQEVSQRLAIGDKSVVLSIALPERVNLDLVDSIPIRTENLNGMPVSARGNIRLTKLKGPGRVLIPSLFESIDYTLEDSLAFIRKFPHIPYLDERNPDQVIREKTVLSEDFVSDGNLSLQLKAARWEEGGYLLEAYIVDGADTLRTSRMLHLHRSVPKKPVDHEFLNVFLAKASYAPGERAELILSSGAGHALVLVEVEQDGKIIRREQVKLNKSVKRLAIDISAADAGPLYVHYQLARYNAVKSGSLVIPVVKPANNITISTRTFRDKLQPGQEETWELSISGTEKDKMLPEVMAFMYDASLDQFAANNVYFPPVSTYRPSRISAWNNSPSYGRSYANSMRFGDDFFDRRFREMEDLNDFGFSFVSPSAAQHRFLLKVTKTVQPIDVFASSGSLNEVVVGYGSLAKRQLQGKVSGITLRGSADSGDGAEILYIVDDVPQMAAKPPVAPENIASTEVLDAASATALYGEQGSNGAIRITTKAAAAETELLNQVPIRKDLKETAFFYPDLRTDEDGNLKIRFTSPERLTEWKFLAFAHTPELQTGALERTVRTSKSLMVVPNSPRFLREGDELVLSAKIVNMSGSPLAGSVRLQFFDANMQPVDHLFKLTDPTQTFQTGQSGSTDVSWRLKVPLGLNAVIYRVVAAADDFSDGEESMLPVLSNKQLVTEAISIQAGEGQTKTYRLPGLAEAGSKEHVSLSLEVATNPFWYALQALPYLDESFYESSEQHFARTYSMLIGAHLINSTPSIRSVLNQWSSAQDFQSPLERNEELKMILLEETPWVQQAENEETRMRRLALLLDLNNLRQQSASSLQRLKRMQLSSGAFPWFEGAGPSESITLHILAGFGHLKNLGIQGSGDLAVDYNLVVNRAITYLDAQMNERLASAADKRYTAGYNDLFYLYARSYFLDSNSIDAKQVASILQRVDGSQFKGNLHSRAMLAIIYHRLGQPEKAKAIIRSLKEYAVQSADMGMYWKDNVSGWNWWESPIETQALLIEAFHEVASDQESVAQMKLWLLKNKQANHWPSSKATTEAIYALLVDEKAVLEPGGGVEVRVGGKEVDLSGRSAGAGYSKTVWKGSEITPGLADVEIRKQSAGLAWGAFYWQYFESLDKIKSSANGIQLEKELYLKRNSGEGPQLLRIAEHTPVALGDLVTVRLIIRSDRDMQFMHLKDLRASGFEPVNVLSTYKWQGGLGYYESTRDAATNFFFDRLPKGTYVFEYDVRANNAGSFSNGYTVLQSVYAPELRSHSDGIRVEIIGKASD